MKNSIIFTLIVAFFLMGRESSAKNSAKKYTLAVKRTTLVLTKEKIAKGINTLADKIVLSKQKNLTVSCCETSKFEFTDSDGFCCDEVTITTCAPTCEQASNQNSALLSLGSYLGFW